MAMAAKAMAMAMKVAGDRRWQGGRSCAQNNDLTALTFSLASRNLVGTVSIFEGAHPVFFL
jgi:hypothetical protein